MLALPEKGINRSVAKHNSDINVLCDWVEASVVFDDTQELSKSDLIDTLIENEVYPSNEEDSGSWESSSQDFASEIVEDVWSEISRRMNYLANPLGITVSGNRITRADDWKSFPAYGFCLALACAELYPSYAGKWPGAYAIQGELFEELAKESFKNIFLGWTVRRIGWSPDNPSRLKDVINSIINELNEVSGSELDVHIDAYTKELGLDLLAYYSFADNHASIPVLLVQCASGRNWMSKRTAPDLVVWKKIVNFNSNPVRAFAIPFALADDDKFRKLTTSVEGVFVDRNRLLGAFRRNLAQVSGVSGELNTRLVEWVSPRMDAIPRDNE